MVAEGLQLAVQWTWTYFLIGAFACFVKIFLEYRADYLKNKKKKQFSKKSCGYDFVSVISAGIVTVLLSPINPLQAIIFGAAWDFIFITSVDRFRGDSKK